MDSYNEEVKDDSEDLQSFKNDSVKIQRDVSEMISAFKRIEEQEKKNASTLEIIKESCRGSTVIIGFNAILTLTILFIVLIGVLTFQGGTEIS